MPAVAICAISADSGCAARRTGSATWLRPAQLLSVSDDDFRHAPVFLDHPRCARERSLCGQGPNALTVFSPYQNCEDLIRVCPVQIDERWFTMTAERRVLTNYSPTHRFSLSDVILGI